MEPFTSVTGVAVPFLVDDVNTDQIAPSGRPGAARHDYKAVFFWRRRLRDDGSEDPEFVLNRPQFRDARIMVGGRNFGCGSSRESAVWALTANNIRCVVARSFADFFRENCLQNGVLALALPDEDATRVEAAVLAADGQGATTVDLQQQRILLPDGSAIGFALPAAERACLLEGLDSIGMTLRHERAIAAWEQRMATEQPWVQALRDSRLPL
jgi:3-isopropylmalate/(R)-2-methylmalate dehydratase small subunit